MLKCKDEPVSDESESLRSELVDVCPPAEGRSEHIHFTTTHSTF